MNNPSTFKISWRVILLVLLLLFLISVNCNFTELFSDTIKTEAAKTEQAMSTSWSKEVTEAARLHNYKTSTARQATANSFAVTKTVKQAATETQQLYLSQTAAAPKPPVITGINFPKEIPGNKSTMIGLLSFTDLDGDISYVQYEVVKAQHFAEGTDNSLKLDSGNTRDGVIKIYIWCEGQQVVTLLATLYDFAGNRSNSMSFTFTCK